MDDEKYQKELFEFEKPKRFFPRLSDFFPKGDFERNVVLTLTLDRAVFVAIGIIMVMVVVYALGVETGKIRAVNIAQQAPSVVAAQPVKVVPTVRPNLVTPPVAQNIKPQAQAPLVVKAQTAPLNKPSINKPYTIIAAAFSRKDIALQEADKLKKQGFTPTISQSGRYFLICVGAYADKAGAESQKDLKRIRRLYKDAYLKLK